MAHLFEPLTIRSTTFRNRIFVSPMCEYSSTDGFADDWHLVHLGSRAVGGAGLVFTEASAVTPEGRISPEDLGIWKDQHVEFLSRITKFIRQQGALAGMQLAHAGRKASTASPWNGGLQVSPEEGGWTNVYAPSAIRFTEGYPMPTEMTLTDINGVCAAFGKAAQRAAAAGFEVIEIHAAHGYLLHEFLSPLSNKRTDQYGGTFENRTRMLREVVAEVRRWWPDRLPLFVRISSSDWVEGGWMIEDSVRLARELKPLGLDFIDCSSGGIVPKVKIPSGPGYQTRFAERIKREADVLTGAVGMITSAAQADTIIRSGQADAVLIAREFLREPYFPLLAAKELGHDMVWPKPYERAKD